ncbi:hypothetical protein FS837_008801 [Tulasnella sp. UAMH 9824]|nr:hypothetical protein FS837_008801 [Tulasnella sp. UAMH 9824]
MSPGLWNGLEEVLTGLCCIQDLWIRAAKISRALFGHFQQCHHLERLVLLQVTTDSSANPTTGSFKSLKNFQFEPYGLPRVTNFFTTILVPELETLLMDSVFLSGVENLCNHQVFQFNPAILRELIIESAFVWSEDMETGLVELLQRANRIRSLKLPTDGFSHGFNLSDNLIRELEVFVGRADLVLTFSRGRPVRDLHAYLSEETRSIRVRTDDVPNLLRPGSVPLERLSLTWISWEDDTMGYIARHCPQLASLQIQAENINGTLSTRYPMPQLCQATFLLVPRPEPWYKNAYESDNKSECETNLVLGSRECWPRLEYLRLDPKSFWRYQGPKTGWDQVREDD